MMPAYAILATYTRRLSVDVASIRVQAPSTRRKVVIIRRGELAQLWGCIPRAVLPEHLGGCQPFQCAFAR